MSSNTRASVKNRANSDPNDEMKRRARRRLVGSLALFLTALIVVPALIEGEPNSSKPEIELVFPRKPGSQEVATDSKAEERLEDPADNSDVIPPPSKAPAVSAAVEKLQSTAAEANQQAKQSAPTAKEPKPAEPVSEPAEPKKPTVQDIAKAAASKEAIAKEAAAKEASIKEAAAKEAAAKEAALRESAKLAAKAELAKKEAAAKEAAAKETAAKEASKPKAVDKSDDAIAKFADTDTKAEAHSKEAPPAASNTPTKPTYIQVAALKDQARAEALKNELSAKGFASRVQSLVTDQGTVYRVRVGPFSDADKADKAKSDLSKQGYNARVAQ